MKTQEAMIAQEQVQKEAIRQMVDEWLAASKRNDIKTLLNLLSEDVLFITPGREPFGKDEFVAGNEMMKNIKMETAIDIKEIKVIGDWAWMRSFLRVTFSPNGQEAKKLSGHILSILQKRPDGQCVIARDANFVAPATDP